MLIFLTGMPGSGKSTTGKLLAAELGYSFLDLDNLVVMAEKMTIPGIFAEKGEEYFRKAESRELRRLQGAKSTVVATGGGTPCFNGNIEWMNQHGITVFLNVPIRVLENRLQGLAEERPLIYKNKNALFTFLTETLQRRFQFYNQAGIAISPTAVSVKELANLVREKEKSA